MLSAEQTASFRDRGYIILNDFWPLDILDRWEQTLVRMYAMQATRIDPLRIPLHEQYRKVNDPAARFTVEEFDKILLAMEAEDKELGYQVLPMVEQSLAGRAMFAPLASISAALLGGTDDLLITSGPHPFINLPSEKRLLYHWHAESNYYPKRRRFLNIWFPIFRDKDASNGTMRFCEGSHQQEWQFIEYQGFDRETMGKRNHFIQYEVPSGELAGFKKTPVVASRGDLVIFARGMVHASTINKSALPSYASVGRVFDYRADLTLSGSPGVRPFGHGDYGRPDLLTHL
jgi:hypothetical protein